MRSDCGLLIAADRLDDTSIIIPSRNEGALVEAALVRMAQFCGDFEVIVVDASDADESKRIIQPLTDSISAASRYPFSLKILVSPSAGRAIQMNHGAQHARKNRLLFLHVDTELSKTACRSMQNLFTGDDCWGRFDVRIDAKGVMFRLIETMINWRSSVSQIATGDQAMFMGRKLYDRVGGFPEIPLMEDIEMSKRLKAISPPIRVCYPITTSARRWQKYGIWRTIILMWTLRFMYWLGVAPARLVKLYH